MHYISDLHKKVSFFDEFLIGAQTRDQKVGKREMLPTSGSFDLIATEDF